MTNERELPRDMSFVDRQGNKFQPNREEYYARKSGVGKAYAFFNCGATKEEIEKTLPKIRGAVKTPKRLELSLMEATENPMVSPLRDPKLWAILKDAKRTRINYFMEATSPNATNRQTANELSAILNQAYQSPLYQKGEQFVGEIVYEHRGRYVSRA